MQHLLIIRTFAAAKGYYFVLPRDGLLPLRGFVFGHTMTMIIKNQLISNFFKKIFGRLRYFI